jgi:hypothetical protein
MASPDYSASANASAGIGESSNVALAKLIAQRTGVNRSLKQLAAAVHAPASNTAATLTKTAISGQYHVIRGVDVSYDSTPTGGGFTIQDVSGTTVYSVALPAAGLYQLRFPVPIRSAAVNTAMIFTLAAGGSGVTGKLNLLGYTAEA